ncbi:hypothetical protein NE237_021711 [Protea cynaroides]|uniref:Uncharacterized protein n=1 Tax=Protea cynaroides TaxID=273540 RepID=A0A9Q0K3I8_9MAGN|nr:hypothetical protein NE237_021711 [Protea cynaroides]
MSSAKTPTGSSSSGDADTPKPRDKLLCALYRSKMSTSEIDSLLSSFQVSREFMYKKIGRASSVDLFKSFYGLIVEKETEPEFWLPTFLEPLQVFIRGSSGDPIMEVDDDDVSPKSADSPPPVRSSRRTLEKTARASQQLKGKVVSVSSSKRSRKSSSPCIDVSTTPIIIFSFLALFVDFFFFLFQYANNLHDLFGRIDLLEARCAKGERENKRSNGALREETWKFRQQVMVLEEQQANHIKDKRL